MSTVTVEGGARDGLNRHPARLVTASGGILQPLDAMHSSPPSPWSPLRNRLFRAVWLATLVSNIGTWMNDVGAGWLMTSLARPPAIVALVAAATTLPVMLLALPAGASGGGVDLRRRVV